jgi:Mg/Co/Ni transporter MgtE
MLCAERMQRIVQAIILGLIMGLAGAQMFQIAFIVTFAMMLILFIAGLTGFCPGLMILKKIFPACECKDNTEKDNN